VLDFFLFLYVGATSENYMLHVVGSVRCV